MDFLKKIKNLNFEKTDVNKNILHNTYFLYFISFLSFGKFFFEMMTGDMYYVSVYIIIAFLLTFFNKNMIVILSLSLIFANILKYGRGSTLEGFDDDHEHNEVDKALGIDDETDENNNEDDGVIDKIIGEEDSKKKKEKPKKKNKKEESESNLDEENDEDEEKDDEMEKKKSKKSKKSKKTKEKFTEKELKNMEYKESEKLLENQKLLLKNMKEYKPFLDTIQGLAKNISGFVKKDSE